jgi:hypothetical protein
MEWLDLVVPSAAILALFGVVALVYVAIRQGRTIRRLEQRLADRGEASIEAPLQRIAELQAREQVSSGRPAYTTQLRTAGIVALACLALLLAIGGLWYLFVRDDGDDGGGTADTPAATTTASNTTANPPDPVDQTIVPADVPAVPDKSIYTVAVFNASGVAGAAGEQTAPRLEGEGWNIGTVANEPNGETRQSSVVMFTRGKRRVAYNVAKDLGITRAPPVDGYTSEQYGDADVIVLVGLDIANGGATATTP